MLSWNGKENCKLLEFPSFNFVFKIIKYNTSLCKFLENSLIRNAYVFVHACLCFWVKIKGESFRLCYCITLTTPRFEYWGIQRVIAWMSRVLRSHAVVSKQHTEYNGYQGCHRLTWNDKEVYHCGDYSTRSRPRVQWTWFPLGPHTAIWVGHPQPPCGSHQPFELVLHVPVHLLNLPCLALTRGSLPPACDNSNQ